MSTTKLSTKGQVVLPRKIREARRWIPGTEFLVQETEDGLLLSPLESHQKTGSVDDLVGCLGYRGRKVSLGEMDDAIRSEAQRRK